MNLNLKHKDEPKTNISILVYDSDKTKLEEIAKMMGLPLSTIVRSALNDIIDEFINLTNETKKWVRK